MEKKNFKYQICESCVMDTSDLKIIFDKDEDGIIGASAGSLFVLKGKYKAVLINYADRNEKKILFSFLNENL